MLTQSQGSSELKAGFIGNNHSAEPVTIDNTTAATPHFRHCRSIKASVLSMDLTLMWTCFSNCILRLLFHIYNKVFTLLY